jgi:alpha-glucuronidase
MRTTRFLAAALVATGLSLGSAFACANWYAFGRLA